MSAHSVKWDHTSVSVSKGITCLFHSTKRDHIFFHSAKRIMSVSQYQKGSNVYLTISKGTKNLFHNVKAIVDFVS